MVFFVGRQTLPLVEAVVSALLVTAVLPGVVVARDLPPVIESRSIDRNAGFGAASNPPANSNANLAQPPVKAPVKTLEARLARLERLLEGQALIEMQMRIDDLQKDLQDLLGISEVQTHTLEGIKKRQRDLYLDIDRRLRQLAQTSPSKPALSSTQGSMQGLGAVSGMHQSQADSVSMPPAQGADATGGQLGPNAPPATAPAVVSTAVASREEQADYQQAFNILKEARYEDSIAAFKNFLGRFPQGLYSGNAQYWIGEANYVMRRFDAAIKEFNTVLASFPESAKIPDAMLKIGYSYYEMQNWSSSRSSLESLVQRYPATTAAQLAKNRLHRMKLEGK